MHPLVKMKLDSEQQVVIRIHRQSLSCSVSDGPGVRSVLYVQGCRQYCKDCHNPQTWSHRAGVLLPVASVASWIRTECLSRRLTISGGEPLDQLPALLSLTAALSEFDLTVYTGYDLQDVPQALRMQVDYLKVGKFDNAQSCSTRRFVGSKNQRFLRVSRSASFVEEITK